MPDIIIEGEIGWEVTQGGVREQFEAVSPEQDIEIDLTSPGGSVYQGVKISNMVRAHKGKTTLTISSLAASMGSHIAARADVVKVFDDSTYMIHNPWIMTVGDYKELAKDSEMMESVAAMLSNAYSKKSEKPKSEVRTMMDVTTWLYGQEIVDAGFADELIDTDDPESKEDAIAFARLQFDECMAKLKDFEAKNQEFNKIAALLPSKPAKSATKPAKTPVNSNQNHGENMTFEEFLAQNPEEKARIIAWLAAESEKTAVDWDNIDMAAILEKSPKAKKEHEKAITDARTEVETGKLSAENLTAVVAVISSPDYGQSIKGAGAKVLQGTKDYSNFEDLVALADEQREALKLAGVIANQPEPTPSQAELDKKKIDQGKTKAAATELSDAINNSEKKVQ